MKNKLALTIAVVLGLVAVYGVYQYIKTTKDKFTKKYQTQRVVAAREYVPAGTVIGPKHILARGREIPESAVTAEHVLQRDAVTIYGQTINRAVERGGDLLISFFRRPVERLHNKLEPGERAVTIRVDAITGIAGNLVPGSHVDIIGTFPVSAGTQPGRRPAAAGATSETRLLLPNVTVLAVDNRLRETQYHASRAARAGAYSTVTLAVVPEEANILIYAQEYGVLTLALRAPADSEIRPLPSHITDRTLLDKAEKALLAREKRLKEPPMTVAP